MAELKTFLFTDISRSVDLKNEMVGRSVTERDVAFISQILTPHRERIEAHLAEYGGRIVSTAGDGHFLVFANTILAAQWAIEVQQSHQEQPIETPGGGKVEVRISVHVGVPQVDPNDPDNFIGKSVDYAARLNDYATGDQILVSRSVMAILDDIGLEGISFHSHGRRPLKGIGQVEVYELVYDDHGPRALRLRPHSHSDRQWTVIPTQGFEGGRGTASDVLLAPAPALKRVGNYELEEVLGSGGMGDVYKGRHTQFGRVRAIKVIKPQFVAADNKEVIRRFYQEIKAVGALEHKNIVVAIDSSTPEDKIHYLVMEYIEGVALDDLVDQRGALSAPDACEVIRQAARGLQYIHRNGMVHRDIKPSNLMITLVDGEGFTSASAVPHDAEGPHAVVKILDLGLALLNEDKHDRLTRYDNKAMGTGMYMSPEQWKTTSVDIRADIYSLGCTLYHLLAGNPPFYDSDLRPEKAHEKSAIPPIRSNDNIPRKLWDVLKKMMAKTPEERYATPAEVAIALTPFIEGSNLVGLVNSYVDPDSAGAAITATRVDTSSRVDTWLSRASHFYPSRRLLLKFGIPLLALLGLSWFAWQTFERGQRDRDAIREQRAQEILASFARASVRNKLGPQLAERFKVLTDSASDPELIRVMEQIDADPNNRELWQPLDPWIDAKFLSNFGAMPAESWFVNNRYGIQVARSPDSDESFGNYYGHRDYFHGRGDEFSGATRAVAEAAGVKPIDDIHLSSVYRSDSTKKLKVAFSVPIWSDGTAETRQVLGVLSMSVNVADFEVLKEDERGGNQVVLVDTRKTGIDGEEMVGLMLYHPEQKPGQELKVSDEVLQAIASKRTFLVGYQDPLADEKDKFWGAIEPVVYSYRDATSGETADRPTGWIVLMQARMLD